MPGASRFRLDSRHERRVDPDHVSAVFVSGVSFEGKVWMSACWTTAPELQGAPELSATETSSLVSRKQADTRHDEAAVRTPEDRQLVQGALAEADVLSGRRRPVDLLILELPHPDATSAIQATAKARTARLVQCNRSTRGTYRRGEPRNAEGRRVLVEPRPRACYRLRAAGAIQRGSRTTMSASATLRQAVILVPMLGSWPHESDRCADSRYCRSRVAHRRRQLRLRSLAGFGRALARLASASGTCTSRPTTRPWVDLTADRMGH
jgi:hypothetical protein